MTFLETLEKHWHDAPPWLSTTIRVTGLLLGLWAVLSGQAYLLQYLGMTLVLWIGTSLLKDGWNLMDRPVRSGFMLSWQSLVREALPPLLVAGVTVAVFLPLARGAMPLMGDHQVHEYNAYIMGSRLLPTGRLMGWTNMAGAGYPAGQLYPILGSLWVAFVHMLGLGFFSWDASYAYALLGVLLFVNLSVYWVGRRLFGPLAGLVAAMAVMTDMGGFRQGGWVFTMQFGVWPLALSMALGLLFFERLCQLSVRPNLKDTIWASFWLALGLLAHPMMLLVAALTIPLGILYGAVVGSDRRIWLALSGAGLLGAGLAAFWLLPFLGHAPRFSAHVSDLWKSLPQIGQDLLTATLYRNTDPWVLVLGATGLGWMTLEGRPKGRLVALTALVLLTVSSITVYAATGIERLLPSIRHIQFERFVMFLKVLLALGAGFVAQRLLAGLDDRADGGAVAPVRPPTLSPHPRIAGLLAAAALAPLVSPLATAYISKRLAPLTNMETTLDRPGWRRALKSLLDTAKKRAKQEPRGFFRIAYWSDFNDHRLAVGPVMSGLPQVKCSFIPAETYRYRAHPQPKDVPSTQKDFDMLAVRFLVTTRHPPAGITGWKLLGKQAGISLYERPDYHFEPASIDQPGKIETLRFDDEKIVLRVSGLKETGRLVMHVPSFPNWEARQNGRLLTIHQEDGMAPHVEGLMAVTVRNGLVEFRYRQRMGDIAAKLLSLVSLLVLVFLILVVRSQKRVLPLWNWIAKWEKQALWTIWAVAALMGLAVVVRIARAPTLPESGRSLTWEVNRAKVWLQGARGKKPCKWFLDGRYICGSKAHQYVGPISEEWGLKNHRGLWAHPYKNARLVIEYPSVTMGKTLAIDHGIMSSGAGGRADVHLRVTIDRTQLVEITHRAVGWRLKRIDTSRWADTKRTVRFEIWTNDISARHFAFDATIYP